jgi:hypothetical protein
MLGEQFFQLFLLAQDYFCDFVERFFALLLLVARLRLPLTVAMVRIAGWMEALVVLLLLGRQQKPLVLQ